LSSSDPELVTIRGLNEREFTDRYVIPMFKEKGYLDVRYTGGSEEYGRDVTFYDWDRFGHREDGAAQVKVGDIRGTTIVQTIVSEAKAAYENPFIDNYSLEEKRVHFLYVVTSGNISTGSLRQIRSSLRVYPRIHFIEGREVLDNLRSAYSQYVECSRVEVIMKETGLSSLLDDGQFIDDAEDLLLLLFNDRGVTELEAINDLPKLLMGLPSVREIVQKLDQPNRAMALHWFSIRLVTKAWYVYGSDKKFGLIPRKLTGE